MLTEFKLSLISMRAKKDRSFKFSNLMHLVNEWSLRESFYTLKKNKAAGIDGVTFAEYEKDLDENIDSLVGKMKSMSYRPQPVRRTYIPKGNGKQRPLGIPCLEDKMVQAMFTRILEAIYEQDFCDFSYGFRPGRNCHQALAVLGHTLVSRPVSYVIDADIKGFFDSMDHDALRHCLEKRVTDERFLRYITRFLKSGIMEEGKRYATEVGTPQGGVISPILANIYLHYALDRWFVSNLVKESEGYVKLVRYADDFVICVESKRDADHMLNELKARLIRCHLELSEEKTRVVRIGRQAQKEWELEKLKKSNGAVKSKPGTFNFLGFTHYCGRSRKGNYKAGRRTEKQRYARSVRRVKEYLRSQRSCKKLEEIWDVLGQMLRGHYGYYGVSDNSRQIRKFYREVENLLYKWLNRRSQRRDMPWEKLKRYFKAYPLPRPRIYHDLGVYARMLCR